MTAEPEPQRLRTAVLALPAEAAGVGAARRWTTDVLTLWGLGADDCSTAALIISELTANAARYGRSDMTIRLRQQADWLHLCVTDSGAASREHRLLVPQELAEHGRGLAIVEALADSVKVTREPEGWRVGAVLRLTTAVRPTTASGAVAARPDDGCRRARPLASGGGGAGGDLTAGP